MIHARIISITNPSPLRSAYVEPISDGHSKYIVRKKYVTNVLLPNLVKAKCFESVEIFPAVTPDRFKMSNGYIAYENINLKYTGPFPANLVSHYLLWKKCIELNNPMMILEDDALFPEANGQIIDSLEKYVNLPQGNYLLYLLSQCPNNTILKTYTKSKLISLNENFFTWSPSKIASDDETYEDVAGTAAYVITPFVAETLCELANIKTEATDRFIGRAAVEKKITVLIPRNYTELFRLHEQTSEWNRTHHNVNAPKWTDLSTKQQSEYLLGEEIELEKWYFDEVQTRKQDPYSIDEYRRRIRNRETNYYGETDKWLYEALDLCPINGLDVAIMGSTQPWYESIVLEFGGKPTTIEYNLPGYNHPEIKEISAQEYWKNPIRFDVAFSISSFEHDGLGRYGDPLNPNGDLRAMWEMKKILKPNGLLFLAVPMGMDKMVWNAHRIYGNKRLRLLLNLWEVIGTVGYEPENLFINTGQGGTYQPILVLKNI